MKNCSFTTFDGLIGKVNEEWLPALDSEWTIRRLKLNALRVHGCFPISASEMEPWVEVDERAVEIGCLRYFERKGKKGTAYEHNLLTLEVN